MPHPPLDRASRTELDDETTVVTTFLSLIAGGFTEGHDALAETAAMQCGVSIRYAASVLRRYTGPDHRNHYWRVREGNRSRRCYELLSPNESLVTA